MRDRTRAFAEAAAAFSGASEARRSVRKDENNDVTADQRLSVVAGLLEASARAQSCLERANTRLSQIERVGRRTLRQSSLFDAEENNKELSLLLREAESEMALAQKIMRERIGPSILQLSRERGAVSRKNDFVRHWLAVVSILEDSTRETATRIHAEVNRRLAAEAQQRAERLRLTGVASLSLSVASSAHGTAGVRQRRGGGTNVDAVTSGLREMGRVGVVSVSPEQVDNESGQTTFIPMPQRENLAQQAAQVLNDRDEHSRALRVIEASLTEIAGVFGRLGSLVQEQGELLLRLDHNVNDSVYNVDSAQSSLLHFKRKIDQQRALILKTFAAVSILILVYIYLSRK